ADARIEAADDAELVVGRGQTIVDALADGLAAYVYGDEGGDGWVTPERYDPLEADGFAGLAEPKATTYEGVRADLGDYDASMGPANRALAAAHDARAHVQELAAVLAALAPRRDPVAAPLRELARLVRLEAATARRAEQHAQAAAAGHTRAAELAQELDETRARAA